MPYLPRRHCDRGGGPSPGFETIGALAVWHAEEGRIAAAEEMFDRSRSLYRSVSPFPVAFLDCQRGQMWLENGDAARARTWFEAAAVRIPKMAQAQGHLAVTEAALGQLDRAISRLLRLSSSSDDPEYAMHLARFLDQDGQDEEAHRWRTTAAKRYEVLCARHIEAFADHAAEFWLTVGDDPTRALDLADRNLAVRPTRRAHHLVARARASAAADTATRTVQND